jgi:histidine phosphotransfer protein HptB
MKIRECYEQMGADYDNVLSRLGSDAMVERFALKFLQEKTFDNLKEAIEKKDAEEAFRAAHTLKGICLNLGFDNLFTVSSELTEKLRPRTLEGSEELLQRVQEQYDITVQALKNVG